MFEQTWKSRAPILNQFLHFSGDNFYQLEEDQRKLYQSLKIEEKLMKALEQLTGSLADPQDIARYMLR